MSLWRTLGYGLRNLLRSGKRDREVADEVEQYFEDAKASWSERGLSQEEAERRVRAEVGTMSAAREQARSFGWENQARAIYRDFRFAARQLTKHKAFTWTAVLTLALGIGANAAIFTVIQSVLMAPLHYANADRLAALDTYWSDSGHTAPRVTGPDAVDVRNNAKTLEAVSLMAGGNEGVQLRDHATYTIVTWVDENFARVFALHPVAGRLFTDAESRRAVLVSEQFARDNFGGAQAALGQLLHIESEAVEIVGVLPAGFHYPDKTEVWEAFPLRPDSMSRTAFMGFESRQLLVVDADAPAHADQDYTRVIAQFNNLFGELGKLPGVASAAGVMGLPTGPYGSNGYYSTQGGLPIDSQHKPYANFTVASPRYFETTEIPMIRGRDFSAQDAFESPFVTIISESLARLSFADSDPIGKRIQCGLDSDKWMSVIGVVGDVRQGSPADSPGPTLYMPMAQHPYYANQIHIVLRTKVEPLALVSAVRQKILAANPMIAMKFTTMDAMVNDSITVERFRAVLLSTFAGMGLLLAMLGVYGTIEYSIAQRKFEIGIRMAFGADKAVILRSIVAHAAVLACCGIAAGFALSLLMTGLLRTMLVGVRPIDPLSLAGAALLLVATAMTAAAAPGWKAAHVDPMTALRAE